MLSRLFDRSVRWLTACLAVAALVTALALPAVAAPRSESGEADLRLALIERVSDWLQAFLPNAPSRPAEPPSKNVPIDSISASGGTACIDPSGNPVACPEDD